MNVIRKYRIESNRKKGYDYRSANGYFITLCEKNKRKAMSEINENGEIKLTRIGQIIEEEWLKTITVRENIELGEYVIMPDHFHGVIIIAKSKNQFDKKNYIAPFRKLISGSLGAIVNQVKSNVTKRVQREGLRDFEWQKNYYDVIIHSKKAQREIENYIKANPLKWITKGSIDQKDRFK
jgi:REP element-mobilizing transposase RayT